MEVLKFVEESGPAALKEMAQAAGISEADFLAKLVGCRQTERMAPSTARTLLRRNI